ncbi:enoyl-CoA hydratase-related protein [Shewanella gelidii]|uniref:Gamma-carboxygeranoyl-CoA hydratase n=1 Tax=Shewanella gelidii TaxID=1642821 RepID=A0A917N7E9_9GAMM|nr:enoyl-CoA hydratase-related protein [Shewanella gelidii]MCL1097351.1 enoyl-CoA hydratase-related protein [Shewanella gelidii]GGI74465.1 gamma-carboxygeranoyl-CoA hydratase [Shewanella gelidii]
MNNSKSAEHAIAQLDHDLQYIQLTLDNGVGEICLNRADKHNAFDEVMIAEIIHALALLAELSTCQVLVLKAKGRNFSAGADLNWMRKQAQMDYQQNLADAHQLAKLMSDLDKFPKPTLALVQGAAFGGALGLICCCDVAIANSKASFCLSEVKLGLIPAVISPYVIRTMGVSASRRYMLTAERFDALTAQQLNIIHEIDDDLSLASAPIIEAFKNNSPQAVAWAKQLIQVQEDGVIDSKTIDFTAEQIAKIRVSEEGQEGLNAFFDKRQPSWIHAIDSDTKDLQGAK